jgi:hypothetical protein
MITDGELGEILEEHFRPINVHPSEEPEENR